MLTPVQEQALRAAVNTTIQGTAADLMKMAMIRVQERLDEELQKLSMLETGSPEYAVTRNYLDWITVLPWGRHSKDKLDLNRARRVLAFPRRLSIACASRRTTSRIRCFSSSASPSQ